MKRLVLIAVVLACVLSGCTGVSPAVVKAIKYHYDIIHPQYVTYVQKDGTLDVSSRDIRVKSATKLKELIDTAAQEELFAWPTSTATP